MKGRVEGASERATKRWVQGGRERGQETAAAVAAAVAAAAAAAAAAATAEGGRQRQSAHKNHSPAPPVKKAMPAIMITTTRNAQLYLRSRWWVECAQ